MTSTQMEVQVLVLVFAVLCMVCVWTEDRIPPSDRHAVYWNSSNTRLDHRTNIYNSHLKHLHTRNNATSVQKV